MPESRQTTREAPNKGKRRQGRRGGRGRSRAGASAEPNLGALRVNESDDEGSGGESDLDDASPSLESLASASSTKTSRVGVGEVCYQKMLQPDLLSYNDRVRMKYDAKSEVLEIKGPADLVTEVVRLADAYVTKTFTISPRNWAQMTGNLPRWNRMGRLQVVADPNTRRYSSRTCLFARNHFIPLSL